MTDVTRILLDIEQGDPKAAEQLLPLVYDELRKLAAQKLAQEKPGQTLQATALVHEAYLRLVGGEPDAHWNSRGHFFAAAAEAMRRILVENARRKKTEKRGGRRQRIDLSQAEPLDQADPDALLDLDELLTRLAGEDPEAAELVKLRLFAGLSVEEAAASPVHVPGDRLPPVDLRAGLAPRPARRRVGPAPEISDFSETFSAPFSHVSVRRREAGTMNADPKSAKAIFLEAVERHAPDQWPAFLDRACAGQPDLRGQVEALLEAHREVGTAEHREPAEGADPGPVATVDVPPVRERPGDRHRPVQAAGTDRRGRLRRRLHGRADRAGAPQGRAEGPQAGHGHAPGGRPLRGRAAGPGDHGPSQHRQGVRRRRHAPPAGRTS